MRTRGNGAALDHAGWDVIFDYGAAQNFVNGITTLFSFTNYGDDYSAFALMVENQDGANAVRGLLDVSHGGSFPCASLQGFDDVAAQNEGCAKIPFSQPGTFVRGQVSNASGLTVIGRWALLGKQRGGRR